MFHINLKSENEKTYSHFLHMHVSLSSEEGPGKIVENENNEVPQFVFEEYLDLAIYSFVLGEASVCRI
jgi:hypothetical protein